LFEINKKLSDKKGAYPMIPAERNVHAKPKLLQQVRTELLINHYSRKTEEAYITYINNNLGRSNSKRENEKFK